ncbi:hypothetical protein BAUCODRAFT_441050 [Baudoinia panamericana UAMH 10762]|uniref:NmrA-like domain-containing protein n=1 Tax=Baudoinia panamericana (strain UAMH 10762) TaxID=717646 RepID=M2NDZ5_BAUPA|nr:uncharacterized protein BAUCODRAFT_441050 [Baudoinia panamericana UAMH 10762]EMC97145.1 hypothetical protein BAUCODRAFT_441050 [Baudoinia panamericana UAMH 10762]
MATKLIVILGITGQQGGSVARVFQALPDWRIRGVTRDPSKSSSASLRDAGIELIAGDLDDPTTLDQAFKGATAIFAVTDFWQFMDDPSTFAQAEKEGRLPNQIAMDREIQQGKNIIVAASKHLATLERLVVSTLSDSEKWSNGKIKWNLHFDGKAKYTQYLKDTYLELAHRTSYVQMGYYLSNWRMNPFFAPQKLEDGSYIYRHMAIPDGKPIPYVDPPNDTGYFVKALVQAPHAGIDMLGYCELMTAEQYTQLWGKALGVQAKFESINTDSLKANGVPDFLALEIGESGQYVTRYGWDGGDPAVKHPKDVGVEVGKLTKVEDWIKREDWSSVFT